MPGALAFRIGASAGGALVSLSGVSVSSTGGGSQTATYTLESDGDVMSNSTAFGPVDEGDWVTPKTSAPGTYEARATLDSGDTPTGTLGTWLALTSNRAWTLTQIATGSKEASLTVEIRKGSGSALASATITLYAERLD
jgi:hypothetical protein